jgi:SAM-dependent methyltransferase
MEQPMSTTTTQPSRSDAEPRPGTRLDRQRLEAAEEHLVDVLNRGALALMVSIGHRTGLFDVMAEAGAADSRDISERAQLDERYVTEWLGAMTTGRILDHDPDADTYTLPPERAALLTRDAGADNLAVIAQYIPMLGAVEDQIVGCFHHGGGVDYDAYPRFHEVMEEDSTQTVLSALREGILPLVPGLTGRLERGIRVIDVGCGRGRALIELAGWFPNSSFAGYDLNEDAIAHARRTTRQRGLDNVELHVQDAARLGDVVPEATVGFATTFDAVHDQADPGAVVRHIRRSLSDDGVYLAQDIDASGSHHGDLDHPIGPLLYTISCLHCMTVSLARGGEGLGAMWGRERAQRLFHDAGFTEIEIHALDHDPQNAFYVCRP